MGQGGKYLLLAPDYEGDTPDGYFTAKSLSSANWVGPHRKGKLFYVIPCLIESGS
jgi:hypothetical protein